jgi:hypothetical protein
MTWWIIDRIEAIIRAFGCRRNRLTWREEAEGRRLYRELLDDIASGDAWGMNPKKDD